MKRFFQQFYFIDYLDFVIFTTRRCHVLFCIFNKYFKVLSTNNKVKFISDKAIHFYGDKLNGSSCAIVDDILIHGRALQSVYNRVKSKSPSKIETYVYMQSKEAQYSADHVIENQVEKNEWKIFSNKIVTAILMTTFPYTSYVYSWSKDITIDQFKSLFQILERKLPQYKTLDISINKVDNKAEINNILSSNLSGYIFDISDFSKKYNLDFSCVRLYYNRYLEKCMVIPYCITHPLSKVEINSIIDYYFSANSDIATIDIHETKYRAITTLYSYSIIRYLKSEYDINLFDFNSNLCDIEMSYYDSFYNELSNSLDNRDLISLSDFSSYLYFNNKKYTTTYQNYNCNSLIVDVYKSVFEKMCEFNNNGADTFFNTSNQVNEIAKILFNYLTRVDIEEEALFIKMVKPNKQVGLPISLLNELVKSYVNSSKNCQITSLDLYTEIISNADSGFISIFADHYFYEESPGMQFYSNFLITGEQVCRLFQNKYVIFITDLYKSYKSFIQKHESSMNFESIFSKLKESKLLNTHKGIIDNLDNAYSFVFLSNNKDFIINNSFDEFNDDFLEELFDKGIEIIVESD